MMDKIIETLSKLFDNSKLFVLALGTVLLVIGGEGKLAFVNPPLTFGSGTRIILGVFGLACTTLPLATLTQDWLVNSPQKLNEKYENEHLKRQLNFKQEELNSITKIRDKFDQILNRIKEIIQGKSDEVSRSIKEIVDDMGTSLNDFAATWEQSKLAAKWLKPQIHSLTLSIQTSQYKGYGINLLTINRFRQEMRLYLELLCERLDEHLYILPAKRNIAFHTTQPSLYTHALQNIKEKIKELSATMPLDKIPMELLEKSLDKLIEQINQEGSR